MSSDQIQKNAANPKHSRIGRAVVKSLSLPVIHDEGNGDHYDSVVHAAPLAISRAHTTATLTSANVALAEVSLGKGANVGTHLSRRLYAKDAARTATENGDGVVSTQDDQRTPRSPLSLLFPAFPHSQLYYRRVPRARTVDPKSTELESEFQQPSRTRTKTALAKMPSISTSKSQLLNSPAPVSPPCPSSLSPSFPPDTSQQAPAEAQTPASPPQISHASSSSSSSSSSTSDFPSLSSSISSTASSSGDSSSSPIPTRHPHHPHPHPHPPHSPTRREQGLDHKHNFVVSRRDNIADKIAEESKRTQPSLSLSSPPSCHQSPHHHHTRRLTCPCFNTSPSSSTSTTTTAGQTSPSPILIHRSRSITFLSSSASSVSPEALHSIRNYSTVALNNSPVECQSLSRSDAAYIAATTTRSSFGASFFNSKRRHSLFGSSSSPTSPTTSPTAASGSHSPDYLTAFFAETHTRPVSIGRRRALAVSTPSTPGQPPPGPPSPGPPTRPRADRVHDATANNTSDTKGSTVTIEAADRATRRPLTIATKHPSVSAPSSPLKLESTSSSLSAPLPANYNNSSNNKTLLRSAVTSRLHSKNHQNHHSRHISLLPNQPPSSPFAFSTVSVKHRSRHNTAPSLYRPIMAPQKAEDISIVTIEHSNHGPVRSTQTTVSGGNWGEPSRISPSQQGAEPNSAASRQDSWTLISGSGFPIPLNSAGSEPASVSTPISVREAQLNRLPALQLLGRYDDTDPVLDPDVAHQIRLELPRKLRNATKWSLVYSSDQHGISMTTLYHRCKGKGPVILAIKDSTDAIFGAYVTEEFKPNLSYYGTGECFLWNVTTVISSPQQQTPASPSFGPSPLPSPSPLQLSSSAVTPFNGRSPSPSPLSASLNASRGNNNSGSGGDRRQDLFMAMNEQLNLSTRSPSPLLITPQHGNNSGNNSPTLRPIVPTTPSSATGAASRRRKRQRVAQFWKWTGKNDYMVLSEPGFIGLGGGDGKFGLWIHSDLETGHSSRCATFDNEPLAAACHHPIRLSNGTQESLGPTAIRNAYPPTASNAGPSSRSGSPRDKSDKGEFFCQTVEIWSIVL
ncbi:hypothetical protein EMPS_10278 [Entomortierella parvispora]|uniref:Oxidation resistance protein 1 n=1 Tax=Entomortierella parvispora TaxID=205924 RepID=A0A9P3M126_9FUNG|nr:hypothetical protein EMPS_10278 [Entomortierella parvispora]